ncbi:MAG: DUF2723 domain-containing protein [Nitrospirae bacterium]|nr:DUF2723 domain-containing protein [Nitrospirota bacterium]
MDAPLGNNCKDTAPTLGAFLFCGAFALYLFTLAPTVTFWDSGELIAASHLLGISHQPGYPLYCILGKGFSLLLPVGSNAFRLNLMSAAFSALTAFVVYKAVLALLDDRAESVAGRLAAPVAASLAFLMAASRTFWSQAVVAEVYALNSFFLALLVLMHVYSRQGRIGAARYVRLSGFVFGLGVVNHVSLAVYLPALALSWGLAPRDENLDEGPCGRITPYLQGVFFALLGLSVFFYLPVRSAAGAGLDIGHPDTPRSSLHGGSSGTGGRPRSRSSSFSYFTCSWSRRRRRGRRATSGSDSRPSSTYPRSLRVPCSRAC